MKPALIMIILAHIVITYEIRSLYIYIPNVIEIMFIKNRAYTTSPNHIHVFVL